MRKDKSDMYLKGYYKMSVKYFSLYFDNNLSKNK